MEKVGHMIVQELYKKLRGLSNKPTSWVMLVILAVAIFTRFWNLPNTLEFLGDQGRDAMIVARIFRQGDLVFIGPVTSVGNMYLGPLYYYFMVPWLFLTYPSPLGPAYAIAFLGVLTVFLVYYLGKELVGPTAALLASLLYAVNSIYIQFSRFSWNPNPAPFVSLLMIWATYRAWKKDPRYWILVAVCFAILIQLHYLILLSAGGAGLIWLWQVYESVIKPKKYSKIKQTAFIALLSVAVVLISLTPLLLFDYKHEWLNATAFHNLLFGESNFKASSDSQGIANYLSILKETHGRSLQLFFEIGLGQARTRNSFLLLTLISVLGWTLFTSKNFKQQSGLLVLLSYLLVGILGTSAYRHTVFPHYIAYLFPVATLLLGVALAQLCKIRYVGRLVAGSFILYFLIYNIQRWPLTTGVWPISEQKRVVSTILDRVKTGEKYNIVLLTGTGDIDGQNYRYFLEASTKPPVSINERGEIETLFIINEDKKIERVVDSPIYEIVVFPNKDIAEYYEVENGPEITVLRRTK